MRLVESDNENERGERERSGISSDFHRNYPEFLAGENVNCAPERDEGERGRSEKFSRPKSGEKQSNSDDF